MTDTPEPAATPTPSPTPVGALALGALGAAFCVPHYQLLSAFLVWAVFRSNIFQPFLAAVLAGFFLLRLAVVAGLAGKQERRAPLLSLYLLQHRVYAVLALGYLVLLLPARHVRGFPALFFVAAALASLAYSVRIFGRVRRAARTEIPEAQPVSPRDSLFQGLLGCGVAAVLVMAHPGIMEMLHITLMILAIFASWILGLPI